ncbi:hypothetical protein ACFQ9X_55915 [Catenulispora yoronensis]
MLSRAARALQVLRAPRVFRAPRAEDGAISIVALILGGTMLAFIGLVWDGGRGMASQQTADDLALEIGRTAAQCVNVGNYLINGTAVLASSAQAKACAAPYVNLVNANEKTNGYTVDFDIGISLSRDTFTSPSC